MHHNLTLSTFWYHVKVGFTASFSTKSIKTRAHIFKGLCRRSFHMFIALELTNEQQSDTWNSVPIQRNKPLLVIPIDKLYFSTKFSVYWRWVDSFLDTKWGRVVWRNLIQRDFVRSRNRHPTITWHLTLTMYFNIFLKTLNLFIKHDNLYVGDSDTIVGTAIKRKPLQLFHESKSRNLIARERKLITQV